MDEGRWQRRVVALGIMLGGGIVSGAVVYHGRASTVGTPPAATAPAWEIHLDRVHEALARGHAGHAVYEWYDAYGAAARTRQWEPMLAVGDAAMKIAHFGPGAPAFKTQARKAYLLSLFRARSQRSPEGTRRIAAAFARLGDADVAAEARRLADNFEHQSQASERSAP
jgi:hypothetical protein